MSSPATGAGRSVVVSVSALLMLAATVVAPAPSHAVFNDTEVFVSTSAEGSDLDSPNDCLTGGSPTERSRFPAIGQQGAVDFDDTLTVTDPDDSNDVATFRIRGRSVGRVVARSGRPASAHFAARLRVDGKFDKGTNTGCDSLGLALAGMVTDFDLHRPTLVNLAVRTTGRLGGSYSLDRVSDPIGGVAGSGEDLPSVQRTTALLTAGTYQLSGDFDTGVSSPILAGDPRSSAGTVSMTAIFTPAGLATSASRGAGRSLVTLPASRACAPRTLTATLRSGASRLDRVVFYVNGRRHAVVGTPAGGRSVVLRNLRGNRAVTVRALLDPKRGRNTQVVRQYAACTA